VRTGIQACGESVDSARGWAIALLLPAEERLPKGVQVYVCYGCSNVHVYAALRAVGCPRLALLLTDLYPRDRLEEEIASWKMWLVRAEKYTRRAVSQAEVLLRYLAGEISAEAARELLSKRETGLRLVREGFLVLTSHLHRLDDEGKEHMRELARKDEPPAAYYAAARLAVNAELERLARMAEAGFPVAPKAIDRFVDTLGELGHSLNIGFLEEKFPEEKLRKWAEMGVGRLSHGTFTAKLWRSDLVPEELRQEVLEILVDILGRVAGLVVPIHLHRLDGYIHAYYE
jgi:hypothetical protein